MRSALVRKVLEGLRSGTTWLLLGSLVAAMGAYLFQFITTRSLGEVRYAPIGALWTIQYLTVSIFLYSVETYVTRDSLRAEGGGSRSVPLIRIWASIAVVAGAVLVSTWWFRDQLFLGRGDLAAVAGCIVLAFGAFMIVRGRLAGSGRFKAYGLVTASESIVRFGLALSGAAIGAGTGVFAWVMPLGALTAASLWPVLTRHRSAPNRQVVRATSGGTARFLVVTTSANAGAQVLLAGGPLILAFLHASPTDISVFFVTVTAARLPIVFVFGGILSRLLSTFVRLADSDQGRSLRQAAARIAAGTAAVALVGGAAAAVVGGPAIGLLFGHGFRPAWWVAAGAAMGVLLGTGSLVLNQIFVATGSEARLPVVWMTALFGSALTVAVTDWSPLARVIAGFIGGEAIALIGLAVAALSRSDRWPWITAPPEPIGLSPQTTDPL